MLALYIAVCIFSNMIRDDSDESNYIFIKILAFVSTSCCLDWVFFKRLICLLWLYYQMLFKHNDTIFPIIYGWTNR